MRFGITVLFATHNGARTLPAMLAALEKVAPPRRPLQILGIDNGSTDATPRILEEAARRIPIETLLCRTPGKMPSLKQGAARASGDLVVLTDDDVIPSPQWLVAYEHAAEQYPDSFMFGGPITPVPLEPLSPWFDASRRHHAVLYARSQAPEGDADALETFFGPNFMIRHEHLDVLHEIPAGLGPNFSQPTDFAMGEDTLIIRSLAERGGRPKYVQNAAVQHLVRAFQTDLSFMLARAERHGRGVTLQTLAASKQRYRTRAKILITSAVDYLRARWTTPRALNPPTPEVFDALWNVHWPLGAIRAALSGGALLSRQSAAAMGTASARWAPTDAGAANNRRER